MVGPQQAGKGGGKASILVVDDQPGIRRLLYEILRTGGWEIRLAANGSEALREVDRNPPLLALIDLGMPDMNGLELLQQMRRRNFRGEVIILSGYSDTELLFQARKQGVRLWVTKPFDLDKLQEMVTVTMRELEKESGLLS